MQHQEVTAVYIGLAALADHYLVWLEQHEAQGWCYAQGEAARSMPAIEGVTLDGRIDRIDVGRGADGAPVWQAGPS